MTPNELLTWLTVIGVALCAAAVLSLRYGDDALRWMQQRRAALHELRRRLRDS